MGEEYRRQTLPLEQRTLASCPPAVWWGAGCVCYILFICEAWRTPAEEPQKRVVSVCLLIRSQDVLIGSEYCQNSIIAYIVPGSGWTSLFSPTPLWVSFASLWDVAPQMGYAVTFWVPVSDMSMSETGLFFRRAHRTVCGIQTSSLHISLVPDCVQPGISGKDFRRRW